MGGVRGGVTDNDKSEVDSAKRLWDAGTDTPRGYRTPGVLHLGVAERGKYNVVTPKHQKKKKTNVLEMGGQGGEEEKFL